METLIIQVNCKAFNQSGTPQLGITVEAPYSLALQQQRQQQQTKDHNDHEYQNFHSIGANSASSSYPRDGISNDKQNNSIERNDVQVSLVNGTSNMRLSRLKGSVTSSKQGEQIQRGLLITQIQVGSLIDKNGQFKVGDIIVEVNGLNLQRRTFQEAQRTLRDLVVKQSSHGPLIFKILRKVTSSLSSLPSTTGSQSTVIERVITKSEIEQESHNSFATRSATLTHKGSTDGSISTPSPRPAEVSLTSNHLLGKSNTRKIGSKHCLRLTKGKDGFGIKIAERDNTVGKERPIYIIAITSTGSAYKDGRLKEGDMLLEINGVDLYGKSQSDVTAMLRGIPAFESVEFVVSRHEEYDGSSHEHDDNTMKIEASKGFRLNDAGCDNEDSLIDLNVPEKDDIVFDDSQDDHHAHRTAEGKTNLIIDGPGTHSYDIPLNDTKSAGLGLYLKYPTYEGKDLGIWIEKVITGGAAWKDGRLQPDDQILAINGINLMGLSNSEASETLTAAVCRGIGPDATANTIRLNVHRRDINSVAKVLHGADNKIGHSDLLASKKEREKCSDSRRLIDTPQDCYLTSFDPTAHSRSQSSNDASSSVKSYQNVQTDSLLSPQTQASSSFKDSVNSSNDKSNNFSSGKASDTSSAISQITDFTTLPIADVNAYAKNSRDEVNKIFTQPKTIESLNLVNDDVDLELGNRSWDEESIDVRPGELAFQRDGFGRRSISEKRHAQLMAGTDTFRRNQKLRQERERQRLLDEQFQKLNVVEDVAGKDQINAYYVNRSNGFNSADNPREISLKRSNSLESIQQHAPRDVLAMARSGTVRVARNRKINESFRAAVDRSYENQMVSSDSVKLPDVSQDIYALNRKSDYQLRTVNSGNLDSVRSAVDDGVRRSSDQKNHSTYKKSTSLLTKFLKLGSMKKSKRKNKDKPNQSASTEDKGVNKPNSNDSQTDALSLSQQRNSHHRRHQSDQHHLASSRSRVTPHETLDKGQHYTNHGFQDAASEVQCVQARVDHTPLPHYRVTTHTGAQIPTHLKHQLPYSKPNDAIFGVASQHPVSNVANISRRKSIPGHQGVDVSIGSHGQPSNNHILPLDMSKQLTYGLRAPPQNQISYTYEGQRTAIQNGCHSLGQWSQTQIPTPNGLWVANSPLTESQAQNIYDHQKLYIPHVHHRVQHPITNHPIPFMPHIAGQSFSTSVPQQRNPTATYQQIHMQTGVNQTYNPNLSHHHHLQHQRQQRFHQQHHHHHYQQQLNNHQPATYYYDF